MWDILQLRFSSHNWICQEMCLSLNQIIRTPNTTVVVDCRRCWHLVQTVLNLWLPHFTTHRELGLASVNASADKGEACNREFHDNICWKRDLKIFQRRPLLQNRFCERESIPKPPPAQPKTPQGVNFPAMKYLFGPFQRAMDCRPFVRSWHQPRAEKLQSSRIFRPWRASGFTLSSAKGIFFRRPSFIQPLFGIYLVGSCRVRLI